MSNTEEKAEKRKFIRFKAEREAYVAIVNDSTLVGQMINISKGGLAFLYIGQEEQITDWHEIDIFLSGNRFYLKRLPFKAISDFFIDNNPPFSTIHMKECRGEFGELTPSQRSRLEYFLTKHTVNKF